MESYAKLLLVEDDLSLAQWVREYLTEQGYAVTHVARGDQVVECFLREQFDLILLDIMLPGKDGIEVCREIRMQSQVPIIMLTAKSDELDEVIGLEIGANDYIVKPVRPRALLARIRSLTRVQQQVSSNMSILEFGQLKLDSGAKRVIYQSKEVSLSSSEFEFLWFLASQSGCAINREEVFLRLKGREYDGQDRRYDLMISTLRKKFSDNSQNPQKIKTIWGKGYLFVADAWD